MADWHVYRVDGKPSEDELAERLKKLEESPPWRSFKSAQSRESLHERKGEAFYIPPDIVPMVNLGIYLRRPLLVTGRPGIGKSSLAYSIAYQLGLGNVLTWSINSRSNLQDALYRYDAIGRIQDTQLYKQDVQRDTEEPLKISSYIRLGPLGTAFASKRQRVLLIDEIDKSDLDLPNDLLEIFEEGRFEIQELARLSRHKQERVFQIQEHDSDRDVDVSEGQVNCANFPIVVMTSNGERDFPPAFLRRCIRIEMKPPDEDTLLNIIKAQFGEHKISSEYKDLIGKFLGHKNRDSLSTDQLLNAVFLLKQGVIGIDDGEKEKIIGTLFSSLSRENA